MKKSKRILLGLVFISLAIVLIMHKLGLITTTIGIGTVILGIICIAFLLLSILCKSIGGFFFSLGLTWICFGEFFGLPKVSILFVAVIAALLTIGFHIIFPTLHKKKIHWDNKKTINGIPSFEENESHGYYFYKNSFGESAKYLSSNDLQRVELHNSFGELKVYFDNANVINEPAEIYVDNSFGEMQLFIPKSWKVEENVKSSFASEAHEVNKDWNAVSPLVKIYGQTSFGEFTINYI